jgi:formate dehydrogenase major subunit
VRQVVASLSKFHGSFRSTGVAKLMKVDRDKHFIAKNSSGTTVNRWLTTGMLAASASSNETAYLTWKVARSFGMLVFDNQARV